MWKLLIPIALVLAIFGVSLLWVSRTPAPKWGNSPRFINDVPAIACVGVTRGEDGKLRAKLVANRYDNPLGEFRVGESVGDWKVIDIVEDITPPNGPHPPMRRDAYCVLGDGRRHTRFITLPETRPTARR